MTPRFILATALSAAAVTAGCAHKAQVKTPAPTPVASTAAKTSDPRPPVPTPAATRTPDVHVSDRLATQCNLHFANTEQAPKFDFDQFSLLPADRDVLQQVAAYLDAPDGMAELRRRGIVRETDGYAHRLVALVSFPIRSNLGSTDPSARWVVRKSLSKRSWSRESLSTI